MGDPTVLGMINENLKSIVDEQKKITGSVAKIDKAQAVDSKRLDHIECDVRELKDGQKKIKSDFWNHANSKKKHYNQGYIETFPQKLKRKSPELTVSGIIITIVSFIVNYYLG